MQQFLARNRFRTEESRCSGFSLVELLVVMVIVGILLAFTTPSLLTLRSTGLTSAGREFANFVNLCRSEAIANRNAIRLGVVVESPVAGESYRKYAAWEWDKISKSYRLYSKWNFLPEGAIFESRANPPYLAESTYASNERSSIRGDYILATEGNRFEETDAEGNVGQIQFLTFSPSGRASLPDGEERNLILVMRIDDERGSEVTNWIQFNVDTLTGRNRVYRP